MPKPENIVPYQFKEGQSGNPAGRPKGSRNLSTILRELLDEEIELSDGEKKKYKEVIIRKLITKANDGDLRAITEIFDRVDGKPTQEIHHEVTETGFLSFDPLSDDQGDQRTQENSEPKEA